jgi:hypothetical protein
VTQVFTTVSAEAIRHRSDLLIKNYERLFRSRVKLSPQEYAKIKVSDPWSYAELGDAVEAWGFRLMQQGHKLYDRADVSGRWFTEEFTPIVRMLRGADLIGTNTDAEAYLIVATERYRLIRAHEWPDGVIEELERRLRSPRRRGRYLHALDPQARFPQAFLSRAGVARRPVADPAQRERQGHEVRPIQVPSAGTTSDRSGGLG